MVGPILIPSTAMLGMIFFMEMMVMITCMGMMEMIRSGVV